MLDLATKFHRLLHCREDCDGKAIIYGQAVVKYLALGDKSFVEHCGPTAQFRTYFFELFVLNGKKVRPIPDIYDSSDERNIMWSPHDESVFYTSNVSCYSGCPPLKIPSIFDAWMFNLANKPAARWMEMGDIRQRFSELPGGAPLLLLRGPETCYDCVFKQVIQDRTFWRDEPHCAFIIL